MTTELSALSGQLEPYAEASDPVLLIRTDEIDRGERLREIDPVWASALGRVMAKEGQRTPIEVCRMPGSNRWLLVSGGHRHAGAEAEEIVYLKAIQVSADHDDRRMREVSENLWRRDLDPIDRAAFVAEAVAIHKRRAGLDPAVDGRVASVSARWQKAVKEEAEDTTATIAIAYGWSDEIGGQIGLSARSIRNDLMLYRRLAPSVVADLRVARHPILTNAAQLRALAKLEEGKQKRVVTRLTLHNAKTVPDALAQLGGEKPPVDPDTKRLSAFIGTFQRMSLSEKKGALAHLADLLPAGFELVEHGGAGAPSTRSEDGAQTVPDYTDAPYIPVAIAKERLAKERERIDVAIQKLDAAEPSA